MLKDKKYIIFVIIFIVFVVVLCVYYRNMSTIDFSGMDVEQAKYLLENKKIEVIEKTEKSESLPEGIVIRTDPSKYSPFSNIKSMVLYVSEGSETN